MTTHADADAATGPLDVLLVEDQAEEAELLAWALEETPSAQVRMQHAATMAEALAHLAAHSVEVVLLDLNLPDSRGLATLHRVVEAAPTVAVVVLTGLHDEELALQAVRSGAQDYLLKGRIAGDTLLRAMRHAHERRRVLAALQESEERFRRLAEATEEGVALLVDGCITDANAAFHAIFGQASPPLDGVPLTALVAEHDRASLAAMLEAGWEAPFEVDGVRAVVHAGGAHPDPLPTLDDGDGGLAGSGDGRAAIAGHRGGGDGGGGDGAGNAGHLWRGPSGGNREGTADGLIGMDTFPAEVRLRRLPGTGRVRHVALVRDLTERRRAEAERRDAEARAAELLRLQDVLRLKTEFMNTAAHELSTPLTPLVLQVEMLRRGQFGPLSPAQERSVALVARNVDRLRRLLAELLLAARLQSRRLGLRPRTLDLATLVTDAVEGFHAMADAKGIRLTVEAEAPKPVEADPDRVAQVLTNLVGNALKFTPAGGRVEVAVREELGRMVVEVRDTGPGLSRSDIARLFQPFVQLGSEEVREQSGTGLGLYISRGIVALHGGQIWCRSDGPGAGSVFVFTLPTSLATPTEAPVVAGQA